jgi:hypothetical protein
VITSRHDVSTATGSRGNVRGAGKLAIGVQIVLVEPILVKVKR